jgi:hypothetical protein
MIGGMNDAETIILNMAASLAPQDRRPFREAALAALAVIPVELHGEGPVHRAVAVEWQRFFRPPDGSTAEVLATRHRERRRASLAG